MDWCRCCCRRLDLTRGLALKGLLVVVKPRGIGAGVEPEKGAGVVAEKGDGGGPLIPGAGRGRAGRAHPRPATRSGYGTGHSTVQYSAVQGSCAGWRVAASCDHQLYLARQLIHQPAQKNDARN